ncbi:hypothetical protein LUZ60_005080 [Juncus effusus]|nr:hypothetical protein LUZ60_005080 [Juncus effusus]
MESLGDFEEGLFEISENSEDEFKSCRASEEEEGENWEETDESFARISGELDEFSVKLFFKGVSVCEESGNRNSGIGVVMESGIGFPVLQVQKKMDFYVEELVAEHLALLDGISVALENNIKKIYAFTNSEKLYFQIAETELLEDNFLVALGHRILELVEKLEDFDLTLVPNFDLEKPLKLAQEAIGIFKPNSANNNSKIKNNSDKRVYCEEREDGDDLSLRHLAQSHLWRRCQQCDRMIEHDQGCYHMTCWCGHEFCYSCGAEYLNGIQSCQCTTFWSENPPQPPNPIPQTDIWSWDPQPQNPNSLPQTEIWSWDTFDMSINSLEGYSDQEREQLHQIQRFLAGGFNLSDHPCQQPPRQALSPPRCSDSYLDTMKDLHQLPWLERFVSVISDNYNDDYIQ